MKPFISLLLTIGYLSFAGAYITDIEVDGFNGQIYVTGDNNFFEVDSTTLLQNAFHNTSGNAEHSSMFVAKRYNKWCLYNYLATDCGYEFVYYPLPLRNQEVLVAKKSQEMLSGLTAASAYDKRAMRVVHSVGRNLTLVNLDTLSVLDSIPRWIGSRLSGRNVIYNSQSKRVTTFHTRIPVQGDFCLSAREYDIATNQFVEMNATYNSQCLTEAGYNATQSPFYKVVFSDCEITYRVSPAKIWCADAKGHKLFVFNANNLSDFRIIPISASFDSFEFDFETGFGYAIDGNFDEETIVGFTIAKIRLNSGEITKTFSNSDSRIDPTVHELDPERPQLYISVEGESAIFSINTETLRNGKVIALNVV